MFSRDWLLQHHLDALQRAAADVLGGQPARHDRRGRLARAVADDTPPPPTGRPAGAGDRSRASTRATPSTRSWSARRTSSPRRPARRSPSCRPGPTTRSSSTAGWDSARRTCCTRSVTRRRGSSRACPSSYLSSERFTNELINAIRYDRTAEFRARYRTIDLLLIDDIQFISGKERTQEEFFHTFNDLYESRKQIIVSSDCSPKDIPEIEERLRSRFEWGLIADIQPPDFETRVAILKKKAALERVRLADDVAYLIASRVKSNIRELEGSLTRMIAFCALTGREMSVDLAQEVLAELWGDEEKVITIEQIQRKVGDFFGIKLSDLKAKNRTKAVAFPRQVAMYLARQLTHASLAEVGRAFGGKDHTTVLHAVDKIQRCSRKTPNYARPSTDLSRASPCDPRLSPRGSTRLIPDAARTQDSVLIGTCASFTLSTALDYY